MNNTDETLKILKASQADGKDMSLLKTTGNFNTTLGLVWYDLEPAAKMLYPVITPLRNMIPRVPGDGGTATNWKGITAINAGNLSAGVSEGQRNAAITTTTANYVATYKGLGFEDYVTWEADYATKNFDDVKALSALGLLRSLMIAEEKCILWGNASLLLTKTPTPTGTITTTGGALAAGSTYDIYCVALTAEGYFNASVTAGIPQSVSRTNVDGTTDTYNGGAAPTSDVYKAAVAASPSTSAAKVACTVTAVKGAAAYAWFCGLTAQSPSAVKLTAITTVNTYTYTGLETQGTQLIGSISASDLSCNTLLFDGLLTQICTAASGAYYKSLDGAALTTNSAGGITEIDTALQSFWDNYRLSPDIMLVSAQELTNINNKVIAAGGAPLVRFTIDSGNGGTPNLTAGAVVGNYLNKYTMNGGSLVKIMLHPNIPTGMIIFYSTSIPYPLSNVSNILQIKTRREYHQIEWPLKTRKYEYGVYVDELLQNYFLPAFGVITNILNG